MKHLCVALLAAMALAACSTTECLKEEEKPIFSVTISKSACFGTCPVYTSTIKGNGTVAFEGIHYVEPAGKRTGTVTPEQLCQLVTMIGRSDFFDQTDHMLAIQDVPTTTITVHYLGKEHVVQWNGGVPDAMAGLHRALVEYTYDNKTLTPASDLPLE